MMKKIFAITPLFITILLLVPTKVSAACSVDITVKPNSDINAKEITVTAKDIPSKGGPFQFESDCGSYIGRKRSPSISNSVATYTYQNVSGISNQCEFSFGTHWINFLDSGTPICSNKYTIGPYTCTLRLTKDGKIDITNKQISWNQRHGQVRATVDKQSQLNIIQMSVSGRSDLITRDFFGNLGLEANSPAGEYTVFYKGQDLLTKKTQSECSASFYVLGPDQTPMPDWAPGIGSVSKPCSAIKNTQSEEYKNCDLCHSVGLDNYGPGSWSVLGCIPTGPEKFIQWLLNSAINIVGGLAFLMILFGSFKVATSSGNPESLNEGKEIIFAALAGLLFIVFSVVLLKIVGADILQIPGFQ